MKKYVNFVDHEHEGEWHPPATVGGTFTRCCTICGIFDTDETANVNKSDLERNLLYRTASNNKAPHGPGAHK